MAILSEPWYEAAAAFRAAVDSGRLDMPLPGSGQTRERWAALPCWPRRTCHSPG